MAGNGGSASVQLRKLKLKPRWWESDSLLFSSRKNPASPFTTSYYLNHRCTGAQRLPWVCSPYRRLHLLLIYISMKKINILLQQEIKQGLILEWAHRAWIQTRRMLRFVYVHETKSPEQDDYSKSWKVSQVSKLVSESNRWGLVTILFVLRA